ncbi:hypothetical protein TSUD_227090 [Trifolium subterraneum]|uniref:Uncharacterized protein n=1 Tax=Trifolium subterraneum TaxID=3900 RepID=A0A2Z6MC35_TRISU|nr:hypothetical protein TSUD_227090 [Trifolium subterraneum]
MGLHVVAMATIHLQLAISNGLSPAVVVAGIVCPLSLKIFMGLRKFREEAIYKTRLFFFRLCHIAFNSETSFANGTRFERFLRLIGQNTIYTTNTTSVDTLNTLSMVAL